MRSLLLLLFIIPGFAANATNYYFAASGNDADNGTSTSTPWQTIAKFNSVFASKSPGDQFLFNKGDVFYGSLIISRSGSAGNVITIGAYGSGATPIITGFTTVSTWNNLGSNIWESSGAISTLPYTNLVVVNSINTPIGRTPNAGTFTYTSHIAGNPASITSSSLNSAVINWTGAEVAYYAFTYKINRSIISSASGNSITFPTTTQDQGFQFDGQGFIIQNDPRTLDIQNEWYYNPSTKKLRVYSTTTPSNVQIATLDSLVYMSGRSFITIDGLKFTGANTTGIYLSTANNIIVQNCSFNFMGRDAIFGTSATSSNNSILNNTINNCNSDGINFYYPGWTNTTISGNTITNCGRWVGMGNNGKSGTGAGVYGGIFSLGAGGLIQYNSVDSTGNESLWFYGNNTVVQNNLFNHADLILYDNGCLYTWNAGGPTNSGMKIKNNIVLNTPDIGIYLDDGSNNMEISGNTVAQSDVACMLHHSWNINFRNNTFYDNSTGYYVFAQGTSYSHSGISTHGNIFFGKTSTDTLAYYDPIDLILPGLTIDSNYYARPINQTTIILTYDRSSGFTQTNRNLSQWQTFAGQDAHSKITPKTISTTGDLDFEYNATSSPVTRLLPFNYIDVKGATYNGTITLQPYTSVVLIKNGTITGNQSPTANAGTDQTITLPTSTVSLSGSGTDPDGTISSYNWTKISGPSGGTITNASSAATTVTGLVQGVYQFELKVTDNAGATGLDTVQVTVNAATNTSPIANAGSDQSITLPTNTASLSGSGTDANGTISAYSWTEISGPSSYNIVNANSPVTDVAGLVQGVYQFELKVTDNNGATGRDTMQVTVNAAANMPPVADAGADQTITLPTSTVTLSGSGSDADGTVVSYVWTKISGPTTYNIVNASSPVTDVTGLVQGVYQFELKVTDNNGTIGTDTMQVTVNAAANIAPVANAGQDQTITLPTNSLTLSGSGSDPDGTISSYQWTKISGPSAYSILNFISPGTSITGLVQGVYQFQLTVTDNNGATGTDTMQVTVNPAPNQPPVANAGSDQAITLPTNTATLSGSGSDPDGTISTYQWTEVSGPSGYNIVNANSPVTDVTGLVQGVYQFQLTVTDNNGATATDVVLVTVNAAPNQPPVVNAGIDQTVTLPVNTITLSGSGSDADGTVVSYVWTEVSGPSGYNIVNANSPVTDVTGLVQGTYQFQLTVTDNNGAIGTDIMQVTVNAAPNIPPVANAGIDQSITLPVNTITLSGSGSDADGSVVSYTWTVISGPSGYNIVNANSPFTDVTSLVQGVYQFQLQVIDNNGAIGTDIMQVTVNAAPNQPPLATAGSDQTITLPVNTVTLSGSGSDADGTVVNYTWTVISGPSGYNIVNKNSPFTDVTGLVQGVYKFQLEVTDNNGATATDIMLVTVNAALNISPVANAGSDQSITLPVNRITLSGSGSDTDGTVVSYAWTEISGPSFYNIVNANSSITDVTGLVQGTYQFQLTVTDNNGAIGTDIMQVTVNAAPNIPPVANAGSDQTITLPVNTVTLSGSGSDADGTIVNYTWTEISGPSFYNIVNANSSITDVTGLVQGVYQFQLQVTDNNGAIGTDIIQVTVNAVPNIPPIANAGPDQTITLPVNTVTLSGSGSDADGTVVSYAWTEISGPSSYNIVNANSSITDVTGLVQGIYQFQLTVTDNNGATATDIITITVNAAANIPPVANAGIDQSITLPTNTVTLSGSGDDADGTVVSYAWTEISGPSSYNIVNANSSITDVTGLVQGVYQFQLTVIDNNGATATDIITITVNAAPNMPPVANAGIDQSVTLPTNTVTLSGSGSDADGTVVSYTWTEISGPSGYNIVNPNSAFTDVTGLVEGVYQFQLQVTDNNGAIGTDIVQVTVNAVTNIPPVANAGLDQTITLPTDSVTFSGSGSDADGVVVSYAWTKISGPSAYTIVNPTLPSTNVTGLIQGVYLFELQVSDDNGATSADTIQVTVNAATNIPPVANAGSDQTITLPTNSVTFLGNGTDADGSIVGYNWTKISGPSGYSIINATSASTVVTGLVQGLYQFQLKVTDNNGAIGTDTIQVIVNIAGNVSPVANAGSDQTITLPTDSVTLSGSGTDADGTIVGYTWTQISGPSGYNILNATSSSTSVTGLVQGVYQFQLEVTDNSGATGTDIVQVIVNAAPNISPVANAGSDQTIKLPVNSVTLSGSGTDADGTVVSYEWTEISGPSNYNIVNAASAVTDITGLVKGIYQFQLKVADNNGATGIDIIKIMVNGSGNIAPIANAGLDQSITLPINTITLSGSGTDADGSIVSYNWTLMSGPSSYNIVNANLPATDVTGLVQGVYQFQLKVTDNKGAIGIDIIQVTVNAAPNQPPVANAGLDQSITLPINTITLSGSGTDADGSVVSYNWTLISGPSSYNYNIVNANLPATDVTGLVEGIYQFELTVTDNSGALGTDIIQVTVNAAPNQPPVANASMDQIITLPTNSLTISGSGSDADGTVVSYVWTKISGPASYNIINPASAVTDINNVVEGVYQFELKVTDNNGATATDIMQVTVNAAPNVPPVANAGSDKIITLPTNSLTVSGSGSDADGTVVSYQWTKISGPANYNILNATSAIADVNNLVQGIYQFELKVTDNNGATATDIMQLTVNAAPNQPPVANAGSDQIITLPTNSLTLSGSGSDADGTVVSYVWTKISGPANYNILNATSAIADVNNLVQGIYQFELKVTDNNGATATDIMQLTVNAAPNQPPVANAGSDQIITLPTNSLTLSGSGSDADGTVVSYQWTKISGPANYNILNATSAVTDINSLVEGVYQFELTVTDNDGAIAIDEIQVTVNAAPNQPPVANAGSDKIITLPTNSVTISGSGSDPDGTVVSYLWTKISGPTNYNILDATIATIDINSLVEGVYQFQLKVTDNNGASATDIMQVKVNAAPNVPPVANAGPDQIITLPANSLTISGSGSDADGIVVGYLWTKVSGPANYNVVNPTSSVTGISGLVQGVYQFQLKVTDNKGATSTDIMQVIVNAAANQVPVANAGADKSITLPTNSLTVSGSGSDADGIVAGYQWSKISGPTSYNIVNPTSAVTDFNGLVQGVYLFELRVTDNNGARGRDTVQITVNAAANIPPLAHASSDITITLPINTASLAGSGSDADGTVVSYVWTKISGPSTYNITNPSSPVTDVWGLVKGVYKFEIIVSDNKGATSRDTMQITVNSATNIAPVANAGKDQTITLPTNSVSLTGSGTDADGTIVGYSWKQISGPLASVIVSANSATTLSNGLVGGTYEFELTVTDNLGAVGKDTVAIVVAEPRLNLDVQGNNIKIYPNPVVDIATLEINTTQANSKLLVVITNMQGQIVYKNELTSGQNNIKEIINISNLSKGTYAVTVYFSNQEKQTIKVIRL